MAFREFVVTPQAVESARRAGLYGEVDKRIIRMAKRSTPFTGMQGNRRFNDFVLRVEDGQILEVSRYDPQAA